MLFTEMKTRSTELNKCVHHGYIVGKILIYPRSTDNVFCAIDKEGTDLKKFFRRYTGLSVYGNIKGCTGERLLSQHKAAALPLPSPEMGQAGHSKAPADWQRKYRDKASAGEG